MKKLYAMLVVMVAAALGAGSALAQVNATGGSAAGLANAGPQAQSAAGASATGGNVGNVSGGAGGAGGRAESDASACAGGFGGNCSPTATAITTQGQGQGQLQGQLQGQGQGQLQGNIGLGSGNKTDILIEAPVIPTTTTLKNTPSIGLGGLYPSAPCMGSSNIGGSGPGFSVGFGTSWTDTNCQLMETARVAPTEKDKTFVWCKSEYAKGAPSCPKEAAKSAEADAPVVAQQAERRKISGQREAAPQAVAQPRPTGSTHAWWQADPALVQ